MEEPMIIPGIGLGPMTDKYDIKILICYLMSSIDSAVSEEQLREIFMDTPYVSYFSFCEGFQELLKSGHIEVGQDRLRLNPLGRETAEKLSRSLPQSLRDNLVTAALSILARIKREKENEVKIRPCDKGFMVECILHDDGFDLMQFTLLVPDMLQAETVRNRFMRDPEKTYRSLIHILLE